MNTLPTYLEDIVYNYEHQLRMKNVMEELLVVFPKLHFNCGICFYESISFDSIKCSGCKTKVICEYCIQEDIDEEIIDYRNCCNNSIPSNVNKYEYIYNEVAKSCLCNECHYEKTMTQRIPFHDHVMEMFNYDMEEMARDL